MLTFGAFSSCSDDFLNETNPNQLSLDTFFKNESDALAAVNSAYGALQRFDLYKRKYFFLHDLLSDELRGNDPLYADGQTLVAYTFNSSSETVLDVWRGLYRGVQRCNYVLDNVDKIEPQSDLLKRIKAEAQFLRGFYYFELVSNWGGVPLELSSSTFESASATKTRASAQEVWAQVEKDLQAAEAALPDTYPTAEKGRATKWSAKALLGKAYLFEKKYPQAAAKLKEIIDESRANPNKIGLVDNYRANAVETDATGQYVEFNKESLFEVSFAGPDRTGGFANWNDDGNGIGEGTFRAIEYGITIFANTSPSLAMVDAYPDSDPRKRMNMWGPGATWYPNKVATPYPRNDWQHKKYSNLDVGSSGDDTQNFNGSSINMRVIRYADVLLMYAEALNAAGQTLSAEAVAAVNQVRARVNLPGITVSNGQQLFQAIINERRLELAFEQIRRRDIARWGIGPQVLPGRFVAGKHELLPIPQQELDLNPGLEQNPGWQ